MVNGQRKNWKPRKVILSFVLGTKKLFEFLDENPIFEFHPSAYTNDPFRIAQNDRMVAINSAIEVDLTGQVCAESIGSQFYSGFGGSLISFAGRHARNTVNRSSRYPRRLRTTRYRELCRG